MAEGWPRGFAVSVIKPTARGADQPVEVKQCAIRLNEDQEEAKRSCQSSPPTRSVCALHQDGFGAGFSGPHRQHDAAGILPVHLQVQVPSTIPPQTQASAAAAAFTCFSYQRSGSPVYKGGRMRQMKPSFLKERDEAS